MSFVRCSQRSKGTEVLLTDSMDVFYKDDQLQRPTENSYVRGNSTFT